MKRIFEFFPLFAGAFVGVSIFLYLLSKGFQRATRNLIPHSYVKRGGRSVLVILIVFVGGHFFLGAGITFPLLVLILIFGSVFLWYVHRWPWGNIVLKVGFWWGFFYLTLSGLLIPLFAGTWLAYQPQRNHSEFGILWIPFFVVFVLDHVLRFEGVVGDTSRKAGYYSGLVFFASWASGGAHMMFGEDTLLASVTFHWATAALGGLLLAAHLTESWSHARRRGWDRVSRQFWPSFTLVFPVCLLAAAAAFAPLWLSKPPGFASGERLWTPEEAKKHLGVPQAGVLACSLNGNGFPRMFIDEGETIGCTTSIGCHFVVREQWEHSAHRFSADPAYQKVVKILLQEAGIETARLCAGCHDPVPLLAGEMVPGAPYPRQDSQGVTCVVCHTISPRGKSFGNGIYRLIPQPQLMQSLFQATTFVDYMMVKDYLPQHREEWGATRLKKSEICGACHNLVVNGVSLRETFTEWKHGPYGPGQRDFKPCIGCHMPEAEYSLREKVRTHDHRFAAANISLPGLSEEEVEMRRGFIHRSLRFHVGLGARSPETVEAILTLENHESGHAFPVAPKDLADFWFEYRWIGRDLETPWKRLGQESIFEEKVIAADGSRKNNHEVWHVARLENEPIILPRESRQWEYRLPHPPKRRADLECRLMYRRFRESFYDDSFSKAGVRSEPVELIKAEATY